MSSRVLSTSLAIALSGLAPCACNPVVKYVAQAQEQGDKSVGITYYVGGAGPIGNIGSWDVPAGLVDGGYAGYIRVFQWQGLTHVGDQMDPSRHRSKAVELAAEMRGYARRYPGRSIHIIALSAGTGVATLALEYLPESAQVDRVIFLGSSLSAKYDLTRALRRIRHGLYVIHSSGDPILRDVVKYTGTVDRSPAEEGIAGLEGFQMPPLPSSDTLGQYAKLHNIPYRAEFADVGYTGKHTDTVRRDFIRAYIAPVLLGDDRTLLPKPRRSGQPPSLQAGDAAKSGPVMPNKRNAPGIHAGGALK